MGPLIPIAMELANFVPGIIKLLTGSDKASDVAEAVVGVAQAATGTASGADALAKLRADPTAVMNFQAAMSAQQIDLEKAYLENVQNARAMQVAALGQEDLFSKRFAYYFATAWSLFTMAYITGVTFWPPSSDAGKANSATVLGFLLGTAVASIFMWLYGSTKNSAEKTRLLAQSAPPKG